MALRGHFCQTAPQWGSSSRRSAPDGKGRAAGNGHRVLESLYDRPIVNVQAIEQLIGGTYAAANGLVARLEQLGILREMTGQKRNRRFCYQPYVELFGDTPQEVLA